MKKLLAALTVLLLLFAVGCEVVADDTDGEKMRVETGLDIPVLSFDFTSSIGYYDSFVEWMTDSERTEYAADVYVSKPVIYAGYADTAIIPGLKEILAGEDNLPIGALDEGSISGILCNVMSDEQKAAIEWYGITDTVPEIEGKTVVAFISVQPMLCVSIFTGEAKTGYYIDRVSYKDQKLIIGGMEEGHYFACMPKSFDQTGYYDGTDADKAVEFMLYRVYEHEGKQGIENDWSNDWENERSWLMTHKYGERIAEFAPMVIDFTYYKNNDTFGTALFDLDAIKQMIIKERAKLSE